MNAKCMDMGRILNTAAVKVILALKEHNAFILELNQLTNITYCALLNVVKSLETEGILKSQKKGRKRFVRLTQKGKAIAENFSNIKKIMEGEK